MESVNQREMLGNNISGQFTRVACHPSSAKISHLIVIACIWTSAENCMNRWYISNCWNGAMTEADWVHHWEFCLASLVEFCSHSWTMISDWLGTLFYLGPFEGTKIRIDAAYSTFSRKRRTGIGIQPESAKHGQKFRFYFPPLLDISEAKLFYLCESAIFEIPWWSLMCVPLSAYFRSWKLQTFCEFSEVKFEYIYNKNSSKILTRKIGPPWLALRGLKKEVLRIQSPKAWAHHLGRGHRDVIGGFFTLLGQELPSKL